MIPSEIWWNYVPAGVSVKENIVQQLMEGRCVLLDTSRLPWDTELLNNVQTDVELADAELNWNEIDAEESIGNKPINYHICSVVDSIEATMLAYEQQESGSTI